MRSLHVVALFVLVVVCSVQGQGDPKPGKCPPMTTDCASPQPTKKCTMDSHCPEKQKCCHGCCKDPISVTCRFTYKNKVYVGECKLEQYCTKKEVACHGIKCKAPWEKCICCFRKKKLAPPKDICNPPDVKPGKCPNATRPCNPAECKTDKDCNLNQKCCKGCCEDPVTVRCSYTNRNTGKTFNGECRLPNQCKKPWKACPGIKCPFPWEKCICCFRKGNVPDKKTCKKGPPPPTIRCTIKAPNGMSWTGVCMDANKCKAPNKFRFPCDFPKCGPKKVCCFNKKGKPPAAYCN